MIIKTVEKLNQNTTAKANICKNYRQVIFLAKFNLPVLKIIQKTINAKVPQQLQIFQLITSAIYISTTKRFLLLILLNVSKMPNQAEIIWS